MSPDELWSSVCASDPHSPTAPSPSYLHYLAAGQAAAYRQRNGDDAPEARVSTGTIRSAGCCRTEEAGHALQPCWLHRCGTFQGHYVGIWVLKGSLLSSTHLSPGMSRISIIFGAWLKSTPQLCPCFTPGMDFDTTPHHPPDGTWRQVRSSHSCDFVCQISLC